MPNFLDRAMDAVGKFVNRATGVGSESQQQFNEKMASTEYQRAMADLKAAGLNPSVLYGQGSGHSAGSAAGGGGVYNAIGGNVNALIHAATELHEDAKGKNKNVAFHTAQSMIRDEYMKNNRKNIKGKNVYSNLDEII